MASGSDNGRGLLLAWDVPPDQEEPWRRFLQELSDSSNHEQYAQSRQRMGVWSETVWLAPKPSGGGVAIVYLQADNPERVLGELAASEAPFDSWYGIEMRRLFGLDVARLERVGSGELLFAWCEYEDVPGEHAAPKKDSG